MSIQYVLGSSGSGKSHYLYENIIRESMKHPGTNYFIIVPEQFTMSTQQQIINMHPSHAIMNIDILSFPRLAYRIFAETGTRQHEVLDDTGKSLVLRKVIEEHRGELKYFARNVGKAGFVEEMKSVISELLQYSVTREDIERAEQELTGNPILKYKLSDIAVLYGGFNDYIRDKFIANEEILEVLCGVIRDSALIAGSVAVLDGFTGFTPIQYRLIGILMELCDSVRVAVTVDSTEKVNVLDGIENLFYLSKSTVAQMNGLADRTGTTVLPHVYMDDEVPYRLKDSKPLVFLEKNLFRNNHRFHDGDVSNHIKLFEAMNPKNEIDYVVGEIKSLVMNSGYRFCDIAVVTADIENYGYLAGNIMEQNHIPCFVDYKRNIMGNVIVEGLRSALEIIEKDFSYESVFRFLKTGLTDFEEDEINQLENYVLALGIRGFSRWNKKWIRTYKSRYEKAADINVIDGFRERLLGILKGFVGSVRKSGTIRDYCVAVYDFIVRLNMPQKAAEYSRQFEADQDVSRMGEYRQCHGKIIGLLDQMVALLGDEEVSLTEFMEILDAGFGEMKVGLIPQKKDSVIIGDLERTRLDHIKVLFFIGINDGNVPRNSSRGGVLSSVDREAMAGLRITLSPDERENAFIQRFYLYQMLTKASDKIYLSYSRLSSDGSTLRVSYLVGVIRSMFPNLMMACGQEVEKVLRTVKIPKAQLIWKEFEQQNICMENARLIYGEEAAGSASRIERFYGCAFAHFVEYGLGLEERAVYDINAADIGTLFHDALERVSGKLRERNIGFTELLEEDRRKIVEEAVLEASTDYNNSVLYKSERSRFFVRRLASMVDMTVWAVGEQLRHGVFTPSHFEYPFHTKDHIVGRIDRIDTCEDDENVYIKIVDYKTGNSDFDLNDAYYGMQLQLITYMQAAVLLEAKLHPDKKINMAGMFYYNIHTPFAQDTEDEDEITQQLLEDLRMRGIVNGDVNVLSRLEKENKGKSIAVPVTFDKEGNARESSSVLTTEKIQCLMEHAGRMIQDARDRMKAGDTAINPFRKADKTACDYCGYREVCGFDPKLPGYGYHNLKQHEEEEIWKRLGGLDS